MRAQLDRLTPGEARLLNIIEIGLHSSSMLRVFAEGSKGKLKNAMLECVQQVSSAESEEQFKRIHANFCNWGTRTIKTAARKKHGQTVKRSSNASYGQIAKTLDIGLKVAFYYCHALESRSPRDIKGWLNAAIDNAMMIELKRGNESEIAEWPASLEEVDSRTYASMQQIVRERIRDEYKGELAPVEFDDLLWRKLNR